MSDIQLLTIVLTLLAILGSMYANRKSVEAMRDVLRAEARAGYGEIRGELRTSVEDIRGEFKDIRGDLQRIGNKIDRLIQICARNSERLERLEKR